MEKNFQPEKSHDKKEEQKDALPEQTVTQPEKNNRPLPKKDRPVRIRKLAWVGLLIPALYIIIQLVLISMPNTQYSLVLGETMTDSIEAEGFVSMERNAVAGGEGILNFVTPSGERVLQGETVIDVYSTEEAAQARLSANRLKNEIEQLQRVQGQKAALGSGDLHLLRTRLNKKTDELIHVLESGDLARLNTAQEGVAETENQLYVMTENDADFSERIAVLQEQLQENEAKAMPQSSIAAPLSGYFVAAGERDRQIPTYEQLQALSASKLQEAMQQPPVYEPENVAGYIIDNYTWHFMTQIPIEQAASFAVGEKIHLNFPTTGSSVVPAKVIEVLTDDAAGIAKVDLLCERVDPVILSLRLEKAEIIFNSFDGLRVEKAAVRMVGGVQGVFIRFGGVAQYKPIQILTENQNYVLVSPAPKKGINELQMYDQVIVEGRDLYDGKVL